MTGISLLHNHTSAPAKPWQLLTRTPDGVHGLAEWLRSWNDERAPEDLCRFSYQERKSDFMRLLTRLGAEPSYKSNKDAIHRAFSLVRHYIGRLGHHFRAINDLLSYSPRLFDILHDFEVRSVPIPTRSAIPPVDEKTTLDSVVSRMLPSQPRDVERYQLNLAEIDAKYLHLVASQTTTVALI